MIMDIKIQIRQQVIAYISLLHKCYFQSCQIKTLHIKRCDFLLDTRRSYLHICQSAPLRYDII